jgi:hypothetical protein
LRELRLVTSTSAASKAVVLFDPENVYLAGLKQDCVGFFIKAKVEDQGRQHALVQVGLGLMVAVGGVGRICLLRVGDRSGAGGSL